MQGSHEQPEHSSSYSITIQIYCHLSDGCCLRRYWDTRLESWPPASAAGWKWMKGPRGVETLLTLIRNVLGEKHASSLADWPLAFLWEGLYVWEEVHGWKANRGESPKAKASWHVKRILSPRPHYTIRGVLFSLSLDSWTAKLFVDQ